MLGYLFGFNARIGRLTFVVGTFGLCIGFALILAAIIGSLPRNHDVLLAQAANSPQIVIAFFAILAINFMLQSMRIRDIGWDPVCVMVGWVALVVIDYVVAGKFPEYALTYQHTGTVVGALVNAGLTLALFFWPGGYSEDAPAQPRGRSGTSDGAWRKPTAPPAAATNRIARVTNGEFGGRTR
ncbi:hypothetical protein UP10_29390 [Bradyrhizobium sp. LTSPM299]|uniref:hypothetical protein n=1 Tax=Bradyrhizobium sp. LTSPM299 TaxID=1619233 RepID=UPI0005C90D74|nr:hypothetical protein [Bradyrhizobium sp. LTSPM299]KJC57196.1 hypothetical protein UP10_29390 [Bradyrhizobium sp. LTSPM299]